MVVGAISRIDIAVPVLVNRGASRLANLVKMVGWVWMVAWRV